MVTADDIVESAKKYSPFRAAWWVALVQGVLAIGLGLLFWLYPVRAAEALAQFLALYLLIHGLFEINSKAGPASRSMAAQIAYYRGIVGALVGGLLLSLLFLGFLDRDFGLITLGVALIIYGAAGLYLAFALQRGNGRILGIISSVLMLALGLAGFLGRNTETSVLGTWVGPSLVVIGLALVLVAFIRRSSEQEKKEAARAASQSVAASSAVPEKPAADKPTEK
jgi:uncharacterized membrane protein HdeD (DUF308 family)